MPVVDVLGCGMNTAGLTVNFVHLKEIRKFCLGFTMVVYEKISGSINTVND